MPFSITTVSVAAVAGLLSLCSTPALLCHAFSPADSFASLLASNSRVRMTLGATSDASSDGGARRDRPEHVVIAGAGVIGTATAYYLAKDFGIRCTLVDPSDGVAPAASGKAGGFLALDWNDHSPVGPLARRSFDLHQQIADDVGAERIQYRRLTCAAISVNQMKNVKGAERPSGKKLEGVEWVEGHGVLGMQTLGTEQTIAQVHPKRLCTTLFDEAQSIVPSTTVIEGKVVGPVFSTESAGGKRQRRLKGVELQNGTVVEAEALLYACGPWTSNVMTGVKYHSVVVPTDRVLSQCVFFSGAGDPEVYVRPDRTAYLTGFPDAPVPVTEEPGHEEVRADKIRQIRRAVQQASPAAPWSGSLMTSPSGSGEARSEGSGAMAVESSCYLPSTPDGLPIMGPLFSDDDDDDDDDDASSMPQCFVAAGHSCWGILMGPASGEAMAYLVATGDESPHVPLRAFRPERFGAGAMRMVPAAQNAQ